MTDQQRRRKRQRRQSKVSNPSSASESSSWQYEVDKSTSEHAARKAQELDLRTVLARWHRQNMGWTRMDMFGIFMTMILEDKHGGDVDKEHATIMITLIGNMLNMVADAIGKIHARKPRPAQDSTGGSDQPPWERPDDCEVYPAPDEWFDFGTKTTSDLEREAMWEANEGTGRYWVEEGAEQATAEEARNDQVAREVEDEYDQEQALFHYRARSAREMHEW